MKKFILLLLVFFFVNNNLSVMADSTLKKIWDVYQSLSSNTDEEIIESNISVYDCPNHYIKKFTTIKKDENGNETDSETYVAFDRNRTPIVQNCDSIEHIVYNHRCYFVIRYSDFGTKYAILKQDNNFVITNLYTSLNSIGNYKFLARKDGLYGIIDLDENQSVPIIYKSLSKIKNGFYKAMLNNRYGLVTIDGKIILPCEYSKISKLGKNYFKVKKNDKWGIIDDNGNIAAQVNYNDVKISKNILYVKNFNGQWGKL